jgi:putative transposase
VAATRTDVQQVCAESVTSRLNVLGRTYRDGVAYKRRDEFPGIHHVTCRGNNKRRIFEDDRDRRWFCLYVTRVARKHGWQISAYCLMANHYHLVIDIDERGMSAGFCELNTAYAFLYNKRHGRVNHLFGKRYWSERLEDQAGYVNACRYVVRNPVRAGLVEDPADWLWSSCRPTLGLARADLPLATDEILAAFAPRRAIATVRYREFISSDGAWPGRWQPPLQKRGL